MAFNVGDIVDYYNNVTGLMQFGFIVDQVHNSAPNTAHPTHYSHYYNYSLRSPHSSGILAAYEDELTKATKGAQHVNKFVIGEKVDTNFGLAIIRDIYYGEPFHCYTIEVQSNGSTVIVPEFTVCGAGMPFATLPSGHVAAAQTQAKVCDCGSWKTWGKETSDAAGLHSSWCDLLK